MSLAITPNSLFARDFIIRRPLREGGMGAVYIAEQKSTGNLRALKLMHPQFLQDPALRARFEQEARVGSRIQSDHIVQVVAAGIDEETGYPYLAMELLRGEDLGAALKRRGALPPAEVWEILAQLCHALAAAHAAGIVHRDLKPENIFLSTVSREGSSVLVKVLDFGIAKVLAEAKTTSTAALGTPLWMAPEQTEAGPLIGPPTDIWALGLIAFRALTGRYYWISGNRTDATTGTLLREILVEELVPASHRAAQLGVAALLPPGFDGWFDRCVRREVGMRFANAAEARAALARVVGGLTPAPPQQYVPSTLAQVPTQYGGPAIPPQGPGGGSPGNTPAGPITWAMAPTPAAVGGAAGTEVSWASTQQRGSGTQLGTPNMPVAAGPYERLSAVAPMPVATPSPGRPSGILLAVAAVAGIVLLMGGAGGLFALFQWRAFRLRSQCESKGLAATAANADGAIQVCASACERSGGKNCVQYGDLIQRFRPSEGAVVAMAAFTKACAEGLDSGCRRQADLMAHANPGQAAELYEKACTRGDGGSCSRLGALYEQGRGVVRDRTRAGALYEKACGLNDALGCVYKAFMLGAGRGIKQDTARAAEIAERALPSLTRACRSGGLRECVALGSSLSLGLGTPRDEPRAAETHQRACDGGDLGGCTNLGTISVLGIGIFKDVDRGMALLQRACDGGESAACTNLGILKAKAWFTIRQEVGGISVFKLACHGVYQVGCSGWGSSFEAPREIAADRTTAVALTTRACESGELVACVNLGAFHQYGVGIATNRGRASELFQKACDSGNAGACGELGTMYARGRGVAFDERRARELLQLACAWGERDSCIVEASHLMNGFDGIKDVDQGFRTIKRYCEEQNVAMACASYGEFVAAGIGSLKDPVRAIAIVKPVCEGRNERPYPDACSLLGSVYENGGPGIVNLPEAARYYQLACDRGSFAGCNNLARVSIEGIGVPKDGLKARQLAEAGCDANDAVSCDTLGYYHSMGRAGFPASGAAALPLFQRACDDGLWTACYNIGLLHLWGIGGLPKDRSQATVFLKLACSHNVAGACQAIRQNAL